jgi:hypothetical protein
MNVYTYIDIENIEEGLSSIEASHWLDRVRNIRVDLLP